MFIAVGWILTACGNNGPPLSPSELAVQEVRGELNNAAALGIEALEQAAPYKLMARFNPSQNRTCGCPDFEVRYYGHWHRVWLDVQEDEARVFLDAYQEEAGFLPRAPELLMLGQPTSSSKRCEGNGQRFTVFTLEAVERL